MNARASEVAAWIRLVYGEAELPVEAGLLHVTAVWRPPSAPALVTMKIGPKTPKSQRDFFLLQLSRARADAIVITGKILREEPHLRYSLVGDRAEALLAWRREVMARTEPPRLVILTSGRELDFGHPVFDGWARPLIYTSPQGVEKVGQRAREHQIEVMSDEAPSVRRLVDRLRAEHGVRTCSMEAGPSTSRELYGETPDECRVDELMLSIFEGEHLPQDVAGGEFLSESELTSRLPKPGPDLASTRVEESSGPWTFYRRWR